MIFLRVFYSSCFGFKWFNLIFFSAKVHQFVSELIYLSVFTVKIRSMFTDWIIKLDLFLDDELGLIHI